MTTIKLSNLKKTYGKAEAVQPLNLTINEGELFGFLGPNGAGKTTTIKMMTGLLEPTEGTVEIAGVDMWKKPLKAKRNIAYLPDQPNLYPKLTGWEYLKFIASVFKVSEETFQARAEKYLHMFNLTDSVDELLESYSHGMKQKIALVGALVHDPKVIFLDEPTVGLDPGSARKLKQLLRNLCDQGTTVFMSTHILEIAETMCDRVGIITEGSLLAIGTMEELRKQGGNNNASLEDIFLELTGGDDAAELIKSLEHEGGHR
ncbi:MULTISPECIES: ABC transporter ATP-binding protein [Bacillaceae]|uniref:ABC transporter ATP-binding protein n=1 Tax=Evansella alkalicola TaxID=745819 RepID=A0ABS6JT96_9BACI|nr:MULTISPECIES: ABC transporter ATP-binding protein [Bacillaceae]MBU9720375.1 ABC transporter ATP-binding protein [Bacillus alkalicola]